MRFLSFNSPTPLDHIPRVLDLLRTMSCSLDRLSVEQNINQSFSVEMICVSPGQMSADTLKHRIAKIQGIEKFHFV